MSESTNTTPSDEVTTHLKEVVNKYMGILEKRKLAEAPPVLKEGKRTKPSAKQKALKKRKRKLVKKQRK